MKISVREQEVLHLIAYEYTSTQIAQKLYISPDTVKTHRKHLFYKLGARNVAGLVRKGFEYGFIQIS